MRALRNLESFTTVTFVKICRRSLAFAPSITISKNLFFFCSVSGANCTCPECEWNSIQSGDDLSCMYAMCVMKAFTKVQTNGLSLSGRSELSKDSGTSGGRWCQCKVSILSIQLAFFFFYLASFSIYAIQVPASWMTGPMVAACHSCYWPSCALTGSILTLHPPTHEPGPAQGLFRLRDVFPRWCCVLWGQWS